MTIAEKLITISKNQQRVYDAGYNKGLSEGGSTEEIEEKVKHILSQQQNFLTFKRRIIVIGGLPYYNGTLNGVATEWGRWVNFGEGAEMGFIIEEDRIVNSDGLYVCHPEGVAVSPNDRIYYDVEYILKDPLEEVD